MAYHPTVFVFGCVVLVYLCTVVVVECGTKKLSTAKNSSEVPKHSFNLYEPHQGDKQVELKPQFLYYPSSSSLTQADTDDDGTKIDSRIGSKHTTSTQSGQKVNFLSSVGSVLGIAGLGILFIAEVTSSFGAPFLIPILLIPLGFIVLVRFLFTNDELHNNQLDWDMYIK